MKVSDIKVDKKFADRLPEPSADQQQALIESIKVRGIIVPLVVTEDGLLLDGHRRLAAAQAAGKTDVPTRQVAIKGEGDTEKALAILLNLERRHLNEAQRADLGSSLLRVERKKAKERKGAGAGRRKKQSDGNGAQQIKHKRKEADLATERVAKSVGTSRKTLERVERVKKADPALAKRMLDGDISIAGAAKKVAAKEIHERGKAETTEKPGLLKQLEDGVAQFRTIYADPPWQYSDAGTGGGVAKGTEANPGGQYKSMSLKELEELPVGTLAHPEGCHLWMWTTWPMLRDGTPHHVLDAWGFRWVGEVVWVKPGLGIGQWLRPATEILVLAVKGKIPLLRDNQKGLLEAAKGKHSEKPGEAYEIIEGLSPGPYVELFARRERPSWMRWGNEA